MKFHYIASEANGKIKEGEMEANGVAEVLEFLSAEGLKPVSLKKEEESVVKKWHLFESSISASDKIFLTKYLSLMLRIGSDLFKAVDILISDFDKESVRSFLFEVRDNLSKGQPFHVAFEKYPKYFSPVFVNLVRAGEVSGSLDKTFEKLSETLQKDQELSHEVRAALTYPILLVIVSVLIVFFISTFALPKIAKLFTDSGFEPPLFSKIVFAIGLFLNQYFLIILAVVIGLVVAFWLLMTQTVAFKKIFQRFIRKLPLIGPLLKKIALQRFAVTFASLLSSGLPILKSLEITANAVGDEELKESLIRIADEGIAKGLTIGEAFKKEPAFPKIISNFVSISEKSGNLSGILFTISDFYEIEIKSSIKVLISFLEPILLLFIGIIVGTIALAVIVPVYQLVGKF